eukprot:scaffold15574_cov121-Skeletonema_marinoi.AAC.2
MHLSPVHLGQWSSNIFHPPVNFFRASCVSGWWWHLPLTSNGVSYSCLGVLVDTLVLPRVDADLLLLCLSSPLSEVDGLRCTERARDEERGRDEDR